MMKPVNTMWALFAACLVLVGIGTLLLFRLDSLSTSRGAPRPSAAAAPVPDSPDHELKELSVQLRRKPGHVPVLMRMAQIERDQGKLADAVAHLRQAAGSEPSNSDVHLELGRVLYEKGARAEALAETEKALALNPRNVDALYNLGAIYANAGDPARARSYWQEAVAADPQSDSGRKAQDGLARLAPAAH